MRRHRPTRVSQCVRFGALACVRPFAMTGSHKSGALHCDVRVAAQVRRVSPSGLPACLHPRMRRSEAARAWSTACWNVRRRVCCSGTRTGVLCSGCTAHRLQAMVHRKLCALSLSPPLTCDAGSARTLTRYSLWPTTPSSSSRCSFSIDATSIGVLRSFVGECGSGLTGLKACRPLRSLGPC